MATATTLKEQNVSSAHIPAKTAAHRAVPASPVLTHCTVTSARIVSASQASTTSQGTPTVYLALRLASPAPTPQPASPVTLRLTATLWVVCVSVLMATMSSITAISRAHARSVVPNVKLAQLHPLSVLPATQTGTVFRAWTRADV